MYALVLTVSGGVDPQMHITLARLTHGYAIDVTREGWAMDQEDICLAVVVPGNVPCLARNHAARTEHDCPIAIAPCLALGTDELAVSIDHEVIALVNAGRDQHAVALADEVEEDRSLRPVPYIDRVIGQGWCGQKLLRSVHASKLSGQNAPVAREMCRNRNGVVQKAKRRSALVARRGVEEGALVA
jgi:hypothetical protein